MPDDANVIETLRREMRELRDGLHARIEGVHDHIRMVAEASAARDEANIREMREMNATNRQDHEMFRNALVNHEGRIANLERRTK